MADIEVEGPDGAVVSFPEGTPHDVMTSAMQRHYGTASTPAAAPPPPGDASAAIGRGIISGVPIVGPSLLSGVNRGIVAPLRAMREGVSYDQALKEAEAFGQSTEAAHPTATKFGEAGGAAVGTIPAVLAAPEAFGAGAAGLGRRMLMSGASGGAISGVDAAVRSGGDTDQTREGFKTGAAAGLLLPGIGAAAGKAVSAALPFFTRPAPDMGRISTGMLANMLTPKAVDAMKELGPLAAPLDASPSLLGLAQGVAAKQGVGADRVVDFVNDRAAGQSGRILGDLNDNLGPAFSPAEVGGMMDARRAAVTPLLAQADMRGQMWSPDLEQLSTRPAVQRALRVAADTASNEGNPLPSVTLDDAGRQVGSDAPMHAYEAATRPRVDGALADLLGVDPASGGSLSAADAIKAQRAAAADPLYARWRDTVVPPTDDLNAVLNRPSVRAAMPGAERKAADQGRTIYAGAGSQWERDPLGTGAIGEPGGPSVPDFDDTASRIRPTGPGVPRPQSLHDFIRSAGGIQDRGGDVASMGLGKLVAKPGQGLGADAMRQAAAQAGYLGGDVDHAMASTDINDLLSAMEDGNRRFSVHDEDALHAWDAYDEAKRQYDARGPLSRFGQMPPASAEMPDVDPRGGTGAPRLTAEGLDYVKRTLDDKITRAQRAGRADDARIFTGLKTQLVDAVDQHPDPAVRGAWQAARQAYAGPTRELAALDTGRAALGDAVTREQVARDYAALGTDGERARYRAGLFSALRDKLAKKSDGGNFVDTVAGNQAIRDKLSTVAPTPEAMQAFDKAISDARQTFTEAQRPDVRGWRYALTNLAEQAKKATGDQAIAIGQAHDALAAHLRTIPEFDRADLGTRAAMRGQVAFDLGRKVVRSGDAQPWPEDFSAAFDKLPIEQQALLRAGARSTIEQGARQNPNDLSALKRSLGGEGDFNRGTMGTLFGPDALQKMLGTVDREQAFSNSRGAIAAGSRTAPMQAGAASIDDATKPADPFFPKDTTMMGLIGNLAENALRKGSGILSHLSNEQVRDQLGRFVTLTGPQREKAVTGILGALADHARLSGLTQSVLANPALAPAVAAYRRDSR